ncbi:MAG: DUF362 domain-containing protein [Puniceicoccales bacterium]|jgi:uncharacterized Fe-S center protein|nr:DUF362 domain-containing protein [Puniceicoccales bacterium]
MAKIPGMNRGNFLKTIGTVSLAAIASKHLHADSLPTSDIKPDKAVKTASPKAKVYMTTTITGKALLAIYKALGKPVSGKVAIKMHWGEPGNKNYLHPDMIRDLCAETKASLVDSNVYYKSPRQTTAGNKKAALDHGYTFAPIDVLDADGEIRLPVHGGKHVKEAIFGSHITNYDWIISVAHFKGHAMAGYGGTFKNLAIGIASVEGKKAIHTNGPGSGTWSCSGTPFFEKIIEYNKALMDTKRDKMIYINILNNLSVACDCDSSAPAPSMPDIGILASLDPVALDKASLDQIQARPKAERRELMERIESRNGGYQVIYAEKMGLGSQQYELVKL